MTRQELSEKYPTKEFGEICIKRNFEFPLTGLKTEWGDEKDYSETANVIDKGWEFFLGHSCDKWVIGPLEDAIEFNKNLQEAIEYCITNP